MELGKLFTVMLHSLIGVDSFISAFFICIWEVFYSSHIDNENIADESFKALHLLFDAVNKRTDLITSSIDIL